VESWLPPIVIRPQRRHVRAVDQDLPKRDARDTGNADSIVAQFGEPKQSSRIISFAFLAHIIREAD
jgi:hypothetical protein